MSSIVVPWREYDGTQAEALIASLLVRTVPGAQRVDGAGGDDGVDVRVPLDGGYHVYEIKSFHSRLTASQKRQIQNSLATAVKRQPNMRQWTLVLPLDVSPAEDRWFTGPLAKQTEVPISWFGRTELEVRLSENRDLLRAFAPGSTERRAMDLLGTYNAESAAMTRGMEDGIPRLMNLKEQLDLTDPDWAFDVEITGDDVAISLRPKDPESAIRRPVGVALAIDSANDREVAESVDRFLRYGRIADFPSQNIAAVAVDLPGNLNEVARQSTGISVSLKKTSDEESWRLSQRIEAVRDNRVLATLPVEWSDRSRGLLGGTWLSGRDRSGFLEIAMRTEPDEDGGQVTKGGLEITAPASYDVLPEEAVPVLQFLSVLRQDDLLRLQASGCPVVEMRLTGQPFGHPDGLEMRLQVAEALARIQSATGLRFPLPRKWTRQDSQMIYFYDQLLAVGQVQWYWPGYAVNVPADQVAQVLAGAAFPRISLSGDSGDNASFELMGHQLQMPGQVHCEVTDMVIVNPKFLHEQIKQVSPWTPLPVHLGQDDRTRSMFYLREVASIEDGVEGHCAED